MKFLIYQLAGGLVMLGLGDRALRRLRETTARPSYLLSDLSGLSIDPTTQKWLFVGFFVAFAIKAPLFPVHTWLPDTTEQATPGHERAAGLHPRQDRRLRHAALLPGRAPGRLAVGDARS